MPERIPVFEPEVEELLLEVASNPDSLLLRGPQRGGVTAPLDLEEGVSARAAGLTVSEKQLLRVWRAEAAEVLRQAFNESLDAAPLRGTLVVPLDLDNTAAPRLGKNTVCAEAQRLGRVAVSKGENKPLARALKMLQLGLPIAKESSYELITLSHRLRPSDKTRICLGVVEAEAGRQERALAMYESIFRRSAATETRAYALCNSVDVLSDSPASAKQLAVAEEAVRVAPKWTFSRLKHLSTLMDLGMIPEAMDSMDRLTELGDPAIEMLEEQLEWHRSSLASQHIEPSIELCRTALHLAERSSGRSQQLLFELGGAR